MLNLVELEQFVSFADNGTLSKAAEVMHISQPTITRTMRHVEEAFGVVLFERGKNKIALSETGKQAVAYARKLLTEAENAVQMVQTFDRSLHTISIESCAPAPLWTLLPKLSVQYPENTISTKLCTNTEVVCDVLAGKCQIGILPFPCLEEGIIDIPFVREQLFVCVPNGHALAVYDELTMEQLNGFNCLLRDEIGFWTELCYQKMPASRFLIQKNEFEMQELVRTSTLLCFTTNLARYSGNALRRRKIIPIINEQADVTYHLICCSKQLEERLRDISRRS